MLDQSHRVKCPNCGEIAADFVRSVRVSSKKVEASLCHCSECDLLFLADPSWLDIAYESEFYGDTGYVKRNIENTAFLELLFLVGDFLCRGRQELQAVDFGTGLGMLPRLMRDLGYNFWGQDEYSSMPLIQPFTNPKRPSDIFTAFEVVEHIQSFPGFLQLAGASAQLVVFSTLLRPVGSIPSNDWWYYAFSNGQHVSFHSAKSIAAALDQLGIPKTRFVTDGSALHAVCLSERWLKVWNLTRRLQRSRLCNPIKRFLKMKYGRKSLTWDDHLGAMALASAGKAPAS